MKRKRNRKRRLDPSSWLQRLGRSRLMKALVLAELLALAGAVYYCLAILSFPFGAPGNLVTPTPIEETLKVPVNSIGPVYTKNVYSDWVSISISGSVQRNGELFNDAFYHYDEGQQRPQSRFYGLLIDGLYALQGRRPPEYRYDHTYGFSHPVNGSLRSTGTDSPRTIGFQVINEAARGLDGVFTIEISSDSYKHKPKARGR